MTDDEIERLLAGALDAQARSAVSDDATPPAPRFSQTATRRPHRVMRVLAPLTAAAAVIAVVVISVGLDGSGHGGRSAAGHGTTVTAPTSLAASTSASRPTGPTAPVHIRLLNANGSQYGVGMPVIAYFSKPITNAAPLAEATTVTVNGKPTHGAWYFERSAAGKGPVEGHFRLQSYWPAHSKVDVAVAAKGLSAGQGLSYDDAVRLTFVTGAQTIATVDDTTHRMTLTRDGKRLGIFPVSLGASATPTHRGIKVVMQKGASICMSGPGYNECGVKYTQRLTYDGEYLHAAPWNSANILHGVDSSNGCTNLLTLNAKTLYGTLEVGDVVRYPNSSGSLMKPGDGYGDWNVSWPVWLSGGLVPTN